MNRAIQAYESATLVSEEDLLIMPKSNPWPTNSHVETRLEKSNDARHMYEQNRPSPGSILNILS
jgi:hypothetical protein